MRAGGSAALAVALGILAGCRAGGSADVTAREHPARSAPGPRSEGTRDARHPPSGTEDAPAHIEALSLELAFELARASHPSTSAAQARLAAARERARAAGRLPNPDGMLRVESASLEGSTFDEAELLAGIGQPLPLGGRLAAAERVAQAEVRRARLELESAQLELDARVRAAFGAALYAQHAVELRAELLRHSRELAAVFAARLVRGDIVPEEGLLAELADLEAQRELERAEALSSAARSELVLALGRPALQVARLTGELEEALSLPALAQLLARIQEDPRILSSEAAVQESEARVALADAERIPDLRLELLYRRIEAADRDAFDLGLSLPLPLFQSGRPRVAESRAHLAERRARQRAQDLALEALARTAHGRLAQALADLERIDREILPREEQVLAARERRFDAGDLGAERLLAARSRLAQARLGRLEALQTALAAWADLAPLLPARGDGPASAPLE